MGSAYRFGMIERFILAMWILLSSTLLITALAASIEDPSQRLVGIVEWWGIAVVVVASGLILMPSIRSIYWEYVADRVPWRKSDGAGGE